MKCRVVENDDHVFSNLSEGQRFNTIKEAYELVWLNMEKWKDKLVYIEIEHEPGKSKRYHSVKLR